MRHFAKEMRLPARASRRSCIRWEQTGSRPDRWVPDPQEPPDKSLQVLLRCREEREALRARGLQGPDREPLGQPRARGLRERPRVRDLQGLLKAEQALLRVREPEVPFRVRDLQEQRRAREQREMQNRSSLLSGYSLRISWKKMMSLNLNF